MDGRLSKYQLEMMEETEPMTQEMRATPVGKQIIVRGWTAIWEACLEHGKCFYCYNHGKEVLLDPDSSVCPTLDAERVKNHANWDTHEIMELLRLQCEKKGIPEPEINPPTTMEYLRLPILLQMHWQCECWEPAIKGSLEPRKKCGKPTCLAYPT